MVTAESHEGPTSSLDHSSHHLFNNERDVYKSTVTGPIIKPPSSQDSPGPSSAASSSSSSSSSSSAKASHPTLNQTIFSALVAGIGTETLFYPVDTVRVRSQAKEGFEKAGGYRNIWKGVGSVAIGSGPGGTLTSLSCRIFKIFNGFSDAILAPIQRSLFLSLTKHSSRVFPNIQHGWRLPPVQRTW